MISTDYLIIGSGIAGLTFAVKIAEKFTDRTVCIITKADDSESNTKYAQGGVAVVQDALEDSFEKHIQDTLNAGAGLCDGQVVEMIVKEGPKRLNDLIVWGANFDLSPNGKLDLGKEGGHSESRIVHHKDVTGLEIEEALLNRVGQLSNINFLDHQFAMDLITECHALSPQHQGQTCFGAYVLNKKNEKVETIRAGATILATGGIGKVYGHTTNPDIATGDGIAMASRAGAHIQDMEFVQFHPTVLYDGKGGRSFLISEAVRGFGAYLKNKEGHRFMLDYDTRAELASRDIVSKSIDQELKKSGNPCVYLDCTHLDIDDFKTHFPNIFSECEARDIAIDKDWIPVVPAAHYICGGITVNKEGRTSIGNLFACGECTRTGLHGANRLASNSLLEALVYAHNIYEYLGQQPVPSITSTTRQHNMESRPVLTYDIVKWNTTWNRAKLQALMRSYVGIVRNDDLLRAATERLAEMYEEIEELYEKYKLDTSLCELRNMITIARLIVAHSLERKENKGGFFNIDNEPST
ncbi:L-aspartate oxidase [Maribacter sp. 2304DJ31-5]|uniref:L-aspartate oxidase n=1 Tax=Maribacter sp. 2304DJ31-5 TaxID=3386273 RepID=UPI0039BD428B